MTDSLPFIYNKRTLMATYITLCKQLLTLRPKSTENPLSSFNDVYIKSLGLFFFYIQLS